MRLGKDNGDWLRLGLSGYQFPDALDVRKRCSWHIVEGEASGSDGDWKFEWQALTCDESEGFSDWLRMAADWLDDSPMPVPAGTDFTEPNLSLTVNRSREGGGLIIVALNTEFRPPWRDPSGLLTQPTVLHIPVDGAELRLAANEWAAEVSRYPNER